jgi:hypothetical protein
MATRRAIFSYWNAPRIIFHRSANAPWRHLRWATQTFELAPVLNSSSG